MTQLLIRAKVDLAEAKGEHQRLVRALRLAMRAEGAVAAKFEVLQSIVAAAAPEAAAGQGD